MFRRGDDPSKDRRQTQADSDYSTRGHSPSQNSVSDARFSAEGASTLKAVAETATLAREIRDGSLSGFVGNGTVINGEASFKSMFRVDGHFAGGISSSDGTLMVARDGRVDANVAVVAAKIQGIVTGDIVTTDRIELGRAAKLTGNIRTPTLIVEEGALFEGTCKMRSLSAVAEEVAASETPPKIERKENVLGSKPKRLRVQIATEQAEDDESAATAAAG